MYQIILHLLFQWCLIHLHHKWVYIFGTFCHRGNFFALLKNILAFFIGYDSSRMRSRSPPRQAIIERSGKFLLLPTQLMICYSSNKIRKTQNEHLNIVSQNLNSLLLWIYCQFLDLFGVIQLAFCSRNYLRLVKSSSDG